MANKDIFVHFPFFCFPKQEKNRNIGKLKFVSLEFLFSNFFTKWEKFKKKPLILDNFEF